MHGLGLHTNKIKVKNIPLLVWLTLIYVHFVAPGILNNKNFAPLPTSFWALHPYEDAFWNRVQLAHDRYFNPILHPKYTKRAMNNSTLYESLLKQNFSDVTNLTSIRRNFDKLPQQMQDFVRHMQRRDYPTLLRPDGVCGAGAKDEKEPTLLLLAIKTTELNFKNRQAIRRTWGQVGWVAGYVRRVFLLGKESHEEPSVDSSKLLQLENDHYGDILQWNFTDTFFNLTLKDVLFWSWFSDFCGQTRFIFKGDDDIFVNTPNMVTYLQHQLMKPRAHKTMKDFMVGDVIREAMPNRVSDSKYFIPDAFYRGLYPAYAGGGGVVYSGLLAKRLHSVSKGVHLFPIDDVYVGMCMMRLKITPVHHPGFFTFDLPQKDAEQLCSYHNILLVHRRSPDQLVKLWAELSKTQMQCWDMPLRDAQEKGDKP
uniref:Hexosyltransferase n=1 Tax=Monopterus albus TaxID=43700 RepID=A0A3Q3JIZ7_MONAL